MGDCFDLRNPNVNWIANQRHFCLLHPLLGSERPAHKYHAVVGQCKYILRLQISKTNVKYQIHKNNIL